MYFSDLLQSTVFHQLVAQCLFSLSFFLHLLVEMLFLYHPPPQFPRTQPPTIQQKCVKRALW